MIEDSGGLDRLSPEELIAMIKEIAAGRGERLIPDPDGPADAFWPEDYYESKPSLSDIRTLIAREQHEIDAQLRSSAPVFVITDSGTRRVHLPTCHHVRHTIHRDEAWGLVLKNYDTLRPADMGMVYRLPHILVRPEIEALNSYVTCRVCAPTLDHRRKAYVLNARPMLALSFGIHHLGRAVQTLDGDDLGFLVGHQRIVSAEGIRSITTTTERVIEGDGTEKYLVVPKPAA